MRVRRRRTRRVVWIEGWSLLIRGRLRGWYVAMAWVFRKIVRSRFGFVDGGGEDSKGLLSSAFATWTGKW